jgi:hypothetical protein
MNGGIIIIAITGTSMVITISISLIRIIDQWAIVCLVKNTITIIVIITDVTYSSPSVSV